MLLSFTTDFHIVHVDEFIDELLREERSCDIILPRIQVYYNYDLTKIAVLQNFAA